MGFLTKRTCTHTDTYTYTQLQKPSFNRAALGLMWNVQTGGIVRNSSRTIELLCRHEKETTHHPSFVAHISPQRRTQLAQYPTNQKLVQLAYNIKSILIEPFLPKDRANTNTKDTAHRETHTHTQSYVAAGLNIMGLSEYPKSPKRKKYSANSNKAISPHGP